jgi:hypothetical protein
VRERLMGFEPTTFCMASSCHQAAEALDSALQAGSYESSELGVSRIRRRLPGVSGLNPDSRSATARRGHGALQARRDPRDRAVGQRPLPSALQAIREPAHVSLIGRGDKVEVPGGAHYAMGSDGKPADDHVVDLRRIERSYQPVGFEDRLSAHPGAGRTRSARQLGSLRLSGGSGRSDSGDDVTRCARDRSTSVALLAASADREACPACPQ